MLQDACSIIWSS